jgi:hypothetical protein
MVKTSNIIGRNLWIKGTLIGDNGTIHVISLTLTIDISPSKSIRIEDSTPRGFVKKSGKVPGTLIKEVYILIVYKKVRTTFNMTI